jgi:thiamine pyrophosphate-dependent acetolactate synthase large subunit-like protein
MNSQHMPLIDSLKVLREVRTDRHVILPTMGSAREWMTLGTHPLDFIYAPSAMGQAPAVGLGLALSLPQKQIIVCNGDGCMLMNLGSLVTITASAPPNFVLIVFENSVYEVTGRQATAAAPELRAAETAVDFGAVARGCGFSSVFAFNRIEDWQSRAQEVLSARGPTFVTLHVAPVPDGGVPKSPAPPVARAKAFAAALQRPTGSR